MSQLAAVETEYEPLPGISQTIAVETPAAAAEPRDATHSGLVTRTSTRPRPAPYPAGKGQSRK